MKANTSLSETFIVAEIDRYIVWPARRWDTNWAN